MAVAKVSRYTQIPFELYERLRRIAESRGVSINAAIVQAIAEFVERHEHQAKEEPAR